MFLSLIFGPPLKAKFQLQQVLRLFAPLCFKRASFDLNPPHLGVRDFVLLIVHSLLVFLPCGVNLCLLSFSAALVLFRVDY